MFTMQRYLKIFAISIIVLVVAQHTVAFKGKKEARKIKDLKNKGKFGDSSTEDGKNRTPKHYYAQHPQNSQRPSRSVRDTKVRLILDEPSDERIQYVHARSKNSLKPQTDENLMFKKPENTCGKKLECGASEKRKQKVSHFPVDETVGKGRTSHEKKGKASKTMKHVYLNAERVETEEESVPEDVEYGVRNRRVLRERKIPAFLVLEDSAVDFLNGDQEARHSAKTLRNQTPKFIMESENEVDLENATGHHYSVSSEDPLEEANSYSALIDAEEEFEEDFL